MLIISVPQLESASSPDVSSSSPSSDVTVTVIDAAKLKCEQCGIHSFPHFTCRCLQCGLVHTKARGCRVAALCHQCRRVSMPHLRCLCCICHHHHWRHEGCPVQNMIVCNHCGILSLPHRQCRCLACNQIHSCGRSCPQRPLPIPVLDRRVLCTQCGKVAAPHLICRCVRCHYQHEHESPCLPGRQRRGSSVSRLRAACTGAIPIYIPLKI